MSPTLTRLLSLLLLVASTVFAATDTHWVTNRAASVQGPYPMGNPSAQPNLTLAFLSPETGARDQ